MQSNFSVFPTRLAEACRLRKVTHDPICAAAVDLHLRGESTRDLPARPDCRQARRKRGLALRAFGHNGAAESGT